jgi:hypothetical protein
MLLPVLLISVVVLTAAATYVYLQNRAFESTIDALRARVAKSADRATATPALPDVVRNYAIRAGGTVGGPAHVHLRQKACC